jgi:hypothetical protein
MEPISTSVSQFAAKLPYRRMQLTVHGDMAKLTHANLVLAFQDRLGVPPPVVGSECTPDPYNPPGSDPDCKPYG